MYRRGQEIVAGDRSYNPVRSAGGVTERLKVPVLKTGMGLTVHREFESRPHRFPPVRQSCCHFLIWAAIPQFS